jgi:nucleoside-diphosphate kinase
MKQQTLIILKPDCVQKQIVGKVVTRFEDAGFKIRACKMIRLSAEVLHL